MSAVPKEFISHRNSGIHKANIHSTSQNKSTFVWTNGTQFTSGNCNKLAGHKADSVSFLGTDTLLRGKSTYSPSKVVSKKTNESSTPSSVSKGTDTRGGASRGKKFYLPLETHLQKGLISYIVPQAKGTKFKDSSLTFFDLNEKETVLYDLKKWFKGKENDALNTSPKFSEEMIYTETESALK